jgi:hypothetical protein
MATVAVSGLLMAAPVTADKHHANTPVVAAAIEMDQPSAPSALALQQAGSAIPPTQGDEASLALMAAPTTTIDRQRADDAPAPTTDGQSGTGAPTIAAPPSTTQVVAAVPTTAPPTSQPPSNPLPTVAPTTPPTTVATPTINTIDALIAVLAPNPDAYGDRGSDLYNKLRDLQNERTKHPDTDHHVIDRAKALINDTEKWVREGKLDPAIGADAIRLVTPLAG